MFSFCILHTNMHHLILQGNGEGHRTYLILRRRRRWWCWVLCFTVSSVSVRFDSSALPFAFSIFFCSLLFLTFSPKLFHSYFFFQCTLSSLCLFSPPLGSVSPLAFIARGRRHFLVTAGVHHGGVKHAPPQTETVPLMVFIYCQNRRG